MTSLAWRFLDAVLRHTNCSHAGRVRRGTDEVPTRNTREKRGRRKEKNIVGGRKRVRKWGCVGTVTSTHCITSLHMSLQHIGRWGIPQCDKNVFGLGEVVKWQVVACATLETRCSSSLRLSWPTLTKIVCVNYFSCVSYIHDISTRLRPSYGSQLYWMTRYATKTPSSAQHTHMNAYVDSDKSWNRRLVVR